MMSMPLLSLCIPTYNRAALLADALQSVLTQMDEETRAWVEIAVSDNASPDDTEEVVRTLAAAHPGIRLKYARQPHNLGADANIYAAMRQSCGEFLWVLSDDDILLPGALRRVLDEVRANSEADAFCLNAGSFVTDSRCLRVLMLPLTEDRTLTGPDDCLALAGASLTFLSCVALRRSLVRDRDYAPRIGSHIIQTYVFLDALAAARQIRVIAQPLVGVRENNSGGYSYYQVFVTNFLDVLRYAGQNGFTGRAVQEARRAHLRRCLFPHVRAEKMNGHGSEASLREGARRLLRAYGPDPFLLFMVLPLLLLPRPLLLLPRPLLRAARALAGRGRR